MFPYSRLDDAKSLMIAVVFWMVATLVMKILKKDIAVRVCKVFIFFNFVKSIIRFVWLLSNKELFYYRYDKFTGELIDSYTTYEQCVEYTLIALGVGCISVIVLLIDQLHKSKSKKASESSCENKAGEDVL